MSWALICGNGQIHKNSKYEQFFILQYTFGAIPILARIIHLFRLLFPKLPGSISKRWFEYISSVDSGSALLFMNYGYSELSPDAPRLELSAEDEQNRHNIQLYHHVARAIDWHGLDALEVSCGRGGGSSYVRRYFKPRSIIGIDITANAIDFCNRHYSIEGLSYMRGDAESLQFASNSVDVIVNIESSICYPNVERFYEEVVRVLKPNGTFLYADLRQEDEIDTWRAQLKTTGLELLKEENITPNVLQALDRDDERKQKLIDQYVPKYLHKPFNEFAGMKGSEFFYGSLKNGNKRYLSFVLRKPIA